MRQAGGAQVTQVTPRGQREAGTYSLPCLPLCQLLEELASVSADHRTLNGGRRD